MRLLGPASSYPPSWLDEVRATMAQPSERWSAKEASNLIAAASEMDAWLNDRRPYKGNHAQGWRSATADFHASVHHVGSKLRQVLSPDLSVALSATQGLPANLSTRIGTRSSRANAIAKTID